jgi:predicted ribosome quality control (RQC) complex YloA/Tae2 family protein
VKLSLSKCWQTADGRLVFQCSSYHDGQRQKGYLVLNASEHEPVRFSREKPETVLTSHGVAAIIRKYAPASQLVGMAVSESSSDYEFIRLKLNSLYVTVCTKPERQIDVIYEGISQARLKSNAQYTIKKPADPAIMGVLDLEDSAFEYWLHNVLSEHHNQITPSVAEKNFPEWRRSARDRLSRRLKTLKKTLAQDERKCPDDQAVKDAEDNARLTQAYLWMVKSEMTALHLDATLTGDNARVIDLNPDLNPGANLERLFIRAKKLRRARELQAPRLKALRSEIELYEQTLLRLRDPAIELTESEIQAVLTTLGMMGKKPAQAVDKHITKKHALGRRFVTADRALITIGRDASESDQIVKSAAAHDWWVHIAGGGHGSHAIITGAATRQILSSEAFRDAAILALHFSDRSRAHEGEVYVARRQQIKKRKGMPPGLWLIERAETRLVRYNADDVAAVFARELREGLQREATRHGNS